MKASLQTKFLVGSMALVLLTTIGSSAAYYVLTKNDKQRESRQHIQIAFDMVLDDVTNRLDTYKIKFNEFLNEDATLKEWLNYYPRLEQSLSSLTMIAGNMTKVTDRLKSFGQMVSVNRLLLYGRDQRLLAVYQHLDNQPAAIGGYVVSGTGRDTYLPLDNPDDLSAMLMNHQPIPDQQLPAGINASYAAEIPDQLNIALFTETKQIGFRITAPVYYQDQKKGVLVGEVLYTQKMVERYAALSKSAINFFVANHLSIGTLPEQRSLEPDVLEQSVRCEELAAREIEIAIVPLTIGSHTYYQGRCAFSSSQQRLGVMTVSLSQEIEKQQIRKILSAILLISLMVSGLAGGLFVFFGRSAIVSIRNIVSVIDATASGDLRQTALVMTQDEIGKLAAKLNQMILQLRTISGQVQHASDVVHGMADVILRQMETFIQHMGQQTTSVDMTTGAIEKIKQFIDTVAQNTLELLSSTSQILASIQETRISIEEVTQSTASLSTNLLLISSAIEQVSQSVQGILQDSGRLEEVAQQTETEISRIEQSFQDISHNAKQTQQCAQETMQAALRGKDSVGASIAGMTDLMTVVSDTAQVIREVNSWGEQVSAILGIVDEITAQTALLALNASIISAQAGAHGRGFAVVADEIKELATRTKTSTKEINTLVHKLQLKTEDGVRHIEQGITKAEHSVQLANAVKNALDLILDSATRSSRQAADTVQVIQQTAGSSQSIIASMKKVIEMVSHIRMAIQEEQSNLEQVIHAVENISGLSEQVNRASLEETKAAQLIEQSMRAAHEKFSVISDQTEALQQDFTQIVSAMRTIKSTTTQNFDNAMEFSDHTVKNLVQQSEMLQKIVNVFKIS